MLTGNLIARTAAYRAEQGIYGVFRSRLTTTTDGCSRNSLSCMVHFVTRDDIRAGFVGL